jgi:hypothetical protein
MTIGRPTRSPGRPGTGGAQEVMQIAVSWSGASLITST